MPCKIDIKAKLENEVQNLTAPAYNKNIYTARSIIKSINDKYNAPVARIVQRIEDQFDINVNIPESLVDKYFDRQKEMEINDARIIQQQDAQRADEEYSDDYMFQLEEESQVKPGVAELFESNPELANIGTQEQYSQYLDTIFPDSKVKDIVYHGSPKISKSNAYERLNLFQKYQDGNITEKEYEDAIKKFPENPLIEKFDKSKIGSQSNSGLEKGFYFTSNKKVATFSSNRIYNILLNIQSPKILDYKKDNIDLAHIKSALLIHDYSLFDSLILENIIDSFDKDESKLGNTYIVFEPEQIHILGSKQDIEGFKEFVGGEQSVTDTYSQQQDLEQKVPQASPAVIKKVKELLDKMGVSLQDLKEYAENHPEMELKGVNAVADVVNKIIAIAEGREAGAITEEMVHIATSIIEQKDPALITKLISKIGNFEIYSKVFERYKNNKHYQTADGKPDIRKIKKEAVDQLIAEIIARKIDESVNEQPLDDSITTMVTNFWNQILDWFKSLYKSSDINLFEDVAEEIIKGDVLEGDTSLQGEVMFQLSENQKRIQEEIMMTAKKVEKREDSSEKSAVGETVDEEIESNFYVYKKADGTIERIKKRVTDRVKEFYNRWFKDKTFTEEQKAMNEYKRKMGIHGHSLFEAAHKRFFDGVTGEMRETPLARPQFEDQLSEEMYVRLEEYFLDVIDKITEGGTKSVLVFSEAIVHDPRQKEAGTIDFLAIDENGKGHVLDWKFMDVYGEDLPWYKKGAFEIQLKRYKEILKDFYGVKEFGMIKAVPILFKFKKVEHDGLKYVVSGINVGNILSEDIEDLKLIPVSEKTETTGMPALDKFLNKLTAISKKISDEKPITLEESDFKSERLKILERAVRLLRGKQDMVPAIELVKIIRRQGEIIIADWEQEFKNKKHDDPSISKERISEFSKDVIDYLQIAEQLSDAGSIIDDLIYNEEMKHDDMSQDEIDELKERKEIRDDFRNEVIDIKNSLNEVKEVNDKFAEKFIGYRNAVTGLLTPEATIQGMSTNFRGVSDLGTAALKILYKLTSDAKAEAYRKSTAQIDKLLAIRKRIVDKGGDTRSLLKKVYQKDEKGSFLNKLILRYDKTFYDKVKENAQEGNRSRKWLEENINLTKYNEEAQKILNRKIERYKHMYGDNTEMMERLIESEINKWDISSPTFTGWTNYLMFRFPLDKWESKEYKEIKKDADILDLYNFISELNERASEIGYINNQVRSSFLPFVRKSFAESLAWDGDVFAVRRVLDELKVRADDVGYGQINELTKEIEYSIPKYYTTDFTRKDDGTVDTSEVSEDLFKNLILYINHSNKYEMLSQIEDQVNSVKVVETFKDHYETGRFGDIVMDESGPVVTPGNEKNAEIFEKFQRALLYGQKEVLSKGDVGVALNGIKRIINSVLGRKHVDTENALSLVKTMDFINKLYQIKTLGFELISGAANAFGANIQLAAQSGRYYKTGEVFAKERELITNEFSNTDRTITEKLFDTFMPLKDDPSYDRLKEAGLVYGTRHNFMDWLFVFMRYPEMLVEKSIFMTLLDNTMVVDGKIVSIPLYVKSKYKNRTASAITLREAKIKIEKEIAELKKTKSIAATKTLDDKGELVIPGLDMSNHKEIQNLTDLTRRLSRSATGNMSDSDINMMSMNIWTRSMMVFKNWIPKLADTRFSEFRKTSDAFSVEIDENGMSIGDAYDIGRARLWWITILSSVRDRSLNIRHILEGNEKGVELIKEMYLEFADKYKKRTGETLNMTVDEFYDMVSDNLRNQVRELYILLGLISSTIAIGMLAPDDDDQDLAAKNSLKFFDRVTNKFIGELSFFYNPTEFHRMLSGSMFPALGLFSDISSFTYHMGMEAFGVDIKNWSLNSEEVREKAQPIKNFARMVPIAKSAIIYGAMFSTEFAKEFDIRL